MCDTCTELCLLMNYLCTQNDMIGPSGYGDANFVSPDEELEYTIRFENDPNATAPAQLVYISHVLDSDLDIRTFRLGSFGFGSFTQEIQFNTAIVQVNPERLCLENLYVCSKLKF